MARQSSSMAYLHGDFAAEGEIVFDARYRFMAAVRERCPRSFEELSNDLFPAYTAWIEGLPKTKIKLAIADLEVEQIAPEDLDAQSDYAVLGERNAELSARIQEWCNRWKLISTRSSDQWTAQFALTTLAWWRASEHHRSGLQLASRLWRHDIEAPDGGRGYRNVILHVRTAWFYQHETEANFRRRAHAELDHVLKRRLPQLKADLERETIPISKKLRPEHFDWLALFRVCGMSLEEIRTTHASHVTDNTAVSHGIHSVARLIGLSLPTRKAR